MDFPNPKHSCYENKQVRLLTFNSWPQGLAQKPQDMVDAGFFYTGQSDKVICYFCSGGMKDWSSEHLPWLEHARWFPSCPYVLLLKGKHFVEKNSTITYEKELNKKDDIHFNQKNISESDYPIKTMNVDNDRMLCKICLEEEISICFIPCGHVSCRKCVLSLKNKCPICRVSFFKIVKMYF